MILKLKALLYNALALLVAIGLAYYSHQGMEAELARQNRSVAVESYYAVMFVLSLLVAPTLRGLIVPAFAVGVKLVRDGRRVTDKKLVIPENEIPPTVKL